MLLRSVDAPVVDDSIVSPLPRMVGYFTAINVHVIFQSFSKNKKKFDFKQKKKEEKKEAEKEGEPVKELTKEEKETLARKEKKESFNKKYVHLQSCYHYSHSGTRMVILIDITDIVLLMDRRIHGIYNNSYMITVIR